MDFDRLHLRVSVLEHTGREDANAFESYFRDMYQMYDDLEIDVVMATDHRDELSPIGATPGDILWRRHELEGTTKIVEVTQRLVDVDSGHVEYVLVDPTHTHRWQYHEDDLKDCFWDTGLSCEHGKPVVDDRIGMLFQRVCEHSFSKVHDPDTLESVGEQCLYCRKRREVSGGE
ncbi:hypothetical protein [Halomontanus rarus]|uniref:hypothetical protein n=1 Tax=Halomontanus rarus TaxID=3034020 RepID=UPI0023E8A2DA|nr:hypothetical protein [Halovivax sp. TS33]